MGEKLEKSQQPQAPGQARPARCRGVWWVRRFARGGGRAGQGTGGHGRGRGRATERAALALPLPLRADSLLGKGRKGKERKGCTWRGCRQDGDWDGWMDGCDTVTRPLCDRSPMKGNAHCGGAQPKWWWCLPYASWRTHGQGSPRRGGVPLSQP